MPGKFTCESEHSPRAHERRRLVLTLHQGTMREPPLGAAAGAPSTMRSDADNGATWPTRGLDVMRAHADESVSPRGGHAR